MKITRRLERGQSLSVTRPATLTILGIGDDTVLVEIEDTVLLETIAAAEPVKHRCLGCLATLDVDRFQPGKCRHCGREYAVKEINHGAIVSGPASYGGGTW